MNEPRVLKLGRPFGAVLVRKSPLEIAVARSWVIDTAAERNQFLRTFNQVRRTLAKATDYAATVDDLHARARRMDPVEEAAMIEALAAERAEGYPA